METRRGISPEERKAIKYVKSLKGFYIHLSVYILVMLLLLMINLLAPLGGWWVIWPALGWGIGILAHAAGVFKPFDIFGPEWEKNQIEKRLGKKA